MLPTDVVFDINLKYDYAKRLYSLFDSYYYITNLLTSEFDMAVYNVQRRFIFDLIKNHKYINYEFNLKSFSDIVGLIKQFHNLVNMSRLIYRGTSYGFYRYKDDLYVISTGIVLTYGTFPEHISYWSILPTSALLFAINKSNPVILVGEMDDSICSPDYYYFTTGELTAMDGKKPINYGAVKYLRESEVRCYLYPKRKVKYVLQKDEICEIFRMTHSLYELIVSEDLIEKIERVCK
ncbi:hypothetical protein AFV9_gp70 [Betalipothrixvirus uzonense]|uniref:Uncharacterized protein n=1 Tax=Betalipothrixvirus uzonense TaxID=512792 RepID=B2CRP7_9VIRU|nr:hypothetical protein AFV9_gp70 [Acidianus filamentous virus 9]ACB37304.1 hypothetical protein [Acidianus filamentous virus 9]